jgi:hypothetical protein
MYATLFLRRPRWRRPARSCGLMQQMHQGSDPVRPIDPPLLRRIAFGSARVTLPAGGDCAGPEF